MSIRPDRYSVVGRAPWPRPFSLFLLVTTVMVLPAFANANPIAFDSFGPSDSYDTGFRYSTGQGFLFEATRSGPLASITVALGRTSESVTVSSFSLSKDAGGGSFGPLLETFTTANTTPPLPATGAVVTIDSLAQPMLEAGQSYWLFFGGSLGSVWFFNDQDLLGLRTSGDIAVLPAFRVAVVPEPGTGVLVLAGLLLLERRRLSRPNPS